MSETIQERIEAYERIALRLRRAIELFPDVEIRAEHLVSEQARSKANGLIVIDDGLLPGFIDGDLRVAVARCGLLYPYTPMVLALRLKERRPDLYQELVKFLVEDTR